MAPDQPSPLDRLRGRFVEPPREFGPTPFFALNDELDPGRLTAALVALADQGVAGVIMHPRTGLAVPYLSETFFDRIGHVIAQCARLGLKAWIYDDYNWPSGAAGGQLLIQRPDLRMRCLEHLFPVLRKGEELILPGRGIAACGLSGNLRDLTTALDGDRLRTPADFAGPALVFFEELVADRTFATCCAPGAPDVDGCLDYLNPDAAAAFIAGTHEQYARRFGEHFGKTVPGIFTDEPQLYRGFPWTARLPGEFLARRGYDLLPHLHLLATDRGDYRKFRCDFYRTVEELYAEGYFLPVRRWCDAHGLLLIGHLGKEEEVSRHSVNHGGLYRPLSAFSLPGIDALGAGEPVNGGLFNMECPMFTPRAAAAVARSGSGRALCEAGGGGGWEQSPRSYKRQLDWLLASGINFFVPHHALLSVKGLRKRDFPPSQFAPSPWFRHYGLHARYLARLSSLLCEGASGPEAAVVFPVSTVRAEERGRGSARSRLSFHLESILTFLASIQREFALVFEEEAAAGTCRAEGDQLLLNGRPVPLLILPPCHTLERRMAETIAAFLAAGGRGVFFDELPDRDADGQDLTAILLPAVRRAVAAGRATQLNSRGPGASREPLSAALANLVPAALTVLSVAPGLLISRRLLPAAEVYFLANLEDRFLELDLAIRAPRASLEVWDPVEGHTRPWPWDRMDDGRALVRLDMEAGESAVLVFSDSEDSAAVETAGEDSAPETEPPAERPVPPLPLVLRPDWEISPEGPNLFLLEPWRVRTAALPLPPTRDFLTERRFTRRTRALIRAGRLFHRFLPVINLRGVPSATARMDDLTEMEEQSHELQKFTGLHLDRFGIYEGIDAYIKLGENLGLYALTRGFPPPGAEFTATITFRADHVPADLALIYEDLGEPVRFALNGRDLPAGGPAAAGWDAACLAIPIASRCRRGRNRLVMQSRQQAFRALAPALHSLEPVALAGSFAVRDKTLVAPGSVSASGGDWVKHGYPHYSGSMTFRARFNLPESFLGFDLWLELGEVRETAEVLINGRSGGVRIYEPYNFDVTDLLTAGENLLEVRVANTAANLLGRPQPSGILGAIRIAPFIPED